MQKTFITVCSVFLVFFFVFAPINYILVQAGIAEYENMGNIIEVEKVYEEDVFLSDFLNGIEETKRLIKDIYINYLPAYVETTFAVKEFKDTINSPFTSWLSEIGTAIAKERMEAKKQGQS